MATIIKTQDGRRLPPLPSDLILTNPMNGSIYHSGMKGKVPDYVIQEWDKALKSNDHDQEQAAEFLVSSGIAERQSPDSEQ